MRKGMKYNSTWKRCVKMAAFAGLCGALLLSCSQNAYEGSVVAVELAGETGDLDGSRLVVIDPEDPAGVEEVLSEDFHSACAPAVNWEGRYLAFQGKETESDPWQIWVFDLRKGNTLRVTELPENCSDPALLPDGSIVFSRESSVLGHQVHDLWRCQMDGTALTRITFDPSSHLHTTLLNEGRILCTSSVQYPEPGEPVMMVMRPDGTKSEIYFREEGGIRAAGEGTESSDGFVYFVGNNGELARVVHRRPLHTFENLSAGLHGRFAAVFPDATGCLVSYRPAGGELYGLYHFEPATKEAPALIFQGEKNLADLVQVVSIPERPPILPSAVNPDNPTGLLMSQDIHHSQLPVHMNLQGDSIADRIRVSGLEKELGIVPVKQDGSFYLKLDADTPFRIETLNKEGETVRGPSDWIYLRPSERRACVGCHADPELAPKNFQPLSVKEDPVVLSTEMKENS